MALLFNDAANEYLEVDSAPVTAPPFSMGCAFKSDDVTVRQRLIFLADKDVSDDWWALGLAGNVGGDPVQMELLDGATNRTASTSSGYSGNAPHVALGVEAANNDRRAYIDGGSKGTDGGTGTPDNVDRLSIARAGDSTPGQQFSGEMAEAAIWSAGLSDAEAAAHGLGFSPLFIQPHNLAFYLPMLGLGQGAVQYDWVGGLAMSEVNTPAEAAHPELCFYPDYLTVGAF